MNYDRKKRTLYIFREVSGVGIGNRALNALVTPTERRTVTIADSAEPKSIDELKLDYSWAITPAKKGPGAVEHGIKWLCELEKIVIDPTRCPRAAREFVNYALEISPRGEVVSRYPDKDNHAIDMVRYALGSDIYSVSVPSSNIRSKARI
jgi:phage terminase large subunit